MASFQEFSLLEPDHLGQRRRIKPSGSSDMVGICAQGISLLSKDTKTNKLEKHSCNDGDDLKTRAGVHKACIINLPCAGANYDRQTTRELKKAASTGSKARPTSARATKARPIPASAQSSLFNNFSKKANALDEIQVRLGKTWLQHDPSLGDTVPARPKTCWTPNGQEFASKAFTSRQNAKVDMSHADRAEIVKEQPLAAGDTSHAERAETLREQPLADAKRISSYFSKASAAATVAARLALPNERLPVLNDTELSALASTVSSSMSEGSTDKLASRELFYEPWGCNVQVTIVGHGKDISAWNKAGHHPNWDNLFFTRIVNNVVFAIHKPSRNGMQLAKILPNLASSARWDCVLELATALAVLHSRGVALGGVSADRIVGFLYKNNTKWTFVWIGMCNSTMIRDDHEARCEVQEFGKLALEILGGLADENGCGQQALIVERLRLCAGLPPVDSPHPSAHPSGERTSRFRRASMLVCEKSTKIGSLSKLIKISARKGIEAKKSKELIGMDSASELLPSVCESFSLYPCFWKTILKYYDAASFYWSGLCALEKNDHTKARESFEIALGLDPFMSAARCGLQQLKTNHAHGASSTPIVWARTSSLQCAGQSPSTKACVAATFLSAGWVTEAWWYSVEALEELTTWESAWRDFDKQIFEELELSDLSETAREWRNSAFEKANRVLSQVKSIASKVLMSSAAFAPLVVLSGVVPSRCACPIMESFGAHKPEQARKSASGRNTQQNLASTGNLQSFFNQCSQMLGKDNYTGIPDVFGWLMGSCELGDLSPDSFAVHVVQPSGLLIYVKGAEKEVNPEKSYLDLLEEEERRVAIFMEYCSNSADLGSWNSYLLSAEQLHAGHRIIHSAVLHESDDCPGEVESRSNNCPRSLLLVYSNNVIDKFKLILQTQQHLATVSVPPTTTYINKLLSEVGLPPIQSSNQVMQLSLLQQQRCSFLLFIRLAPQNLQVLKVGLYHRQNEFRALEAHALCVSTFPELTDEARAQQAKRSIRKNQMEMKLQEKTPIFGIPKQTTIEHRFRYVIVGGGVAAGYACREFIKHGVQKEQILLISREPYVPYERPALSKGVILEKAKYPGFCTCAFEADPKNESWYHDNGIVLFLSTSVTSVDFQRGRLQTDTKGDVLYEHCMLCTGAAPLYLDIPGAALKGIYYLRNINDTNKIIKASKRSPGGKVAVIGGGYLGIESAAACIDRGHSVFLIYRGRHLMSRLWSPEVAAHYEAYFAAKGCTLLSEDIVTCIEADASGTRACRLQLLSGRSIKIDFVVCCVGATIPRTLYEGKLDLQGRGIWVNQHFQTSVDNVYAVGDIACFPVKCMGRREVMEHVGHARKSAVHAVKHMLRVKDLCEYDYRPFFYSRFFNLSWILHGDPHGQQFIACKEGVDSLPGKSLKICSVWLKGSGGINGIFLEGASEEQQKFVAKLVHEKFKVSLDRIARLQTTNKAEAACYDDLFAVLECAELDEQIYDTQPCALSKAEISKMLQKLPMSEYHQVGTSDFQKQCENAFDKAAVDSGGASLREEEILQATDLALAGPLSERARFLHVNMRNGNQINECLTHFGGHCGRDFSVTKDDLYPFIMFALAYFIWKNLKKKVTDKKKGDIASAAETKSKFQKKSCAKEEQDDELDYTHALKSIPESAAVFFVPHTQEALLCLDNRLVWWQLPYFAKHTHIIDGEVQAHRGRDLPFVVSSTWRLCGETLAAVTTLPHNLVLLDAALGDIKYFIPLQLAGLLPAPSCGLSVSNGVIAVSHQGRGRIWAPSYVNAKEYKGLSISDAMHKALFPQERSKKPKVRSGWQLPPERPAYSTKQPTPVAVFDTACACADQCLVLPHFALWCTSNSVHASFYQPDNLIRTHSEDSTTKQVMNASLLSRMAFLEPTAPVVHLEEVWSTMSNTLAHLEDLASKCQSKHFDHHMAVRMNATLECCEKISAPLHLAFYPKLRTLNASLCNWLREPRPSKVWEKWAQLLMRAFGFLTALTSKSMLEKMQAEDGKSYHSNGKCRHLNDLISLSAGESRGNNEAETSQMAAAAINSSGHRLLLVIRHGSTWFVQFWLWDEKLANWKQSWSTVCCETVHATGSSFRCGISGDGLIAATAACDVKILDVADGATTQTLEWENNSDVNNPAVAIWISENGKNLIVHATQGIYVWSHKFDKGLRLHLWSLVQSIGTDEIKPGDLPHPQLTVASCNFRNHSYSIAAVFDRLPKDATTIMKDDSKQTKLSDETVEFKEKSWCFILRHTDKDDEAESSAYRLLRKHSHMKHSNKILNVWMTKYRIYFLTDGYLEIWQIPYQSSPNQVHWEDIAPLTAWMHLKTSSAVTTIGSLQASMFLASFQLPQHPVLESVNFNPFSQVLYGWSNECSAVYCFVIPWAKYFVGQDYLIPDLALHLTVGDHQTAPSFLLTSANDLVFMIAGTSWSSWSIDFTEFVHISKDDSTCSCGRKRVRDSTVLKEPTVDLLNYRNSSERGSNDRASKFKANRSSTQEMFSANVQKMTAFKKISTEPERAGNKGSSQTMWDSPPPSPGGRRRRRSGDVWDNQPPSPSSGRRRRSGDAGGSKDSTQSSARMSFESSTRMSFEKAESSSQKGSNDRASIWKANRSTTQEMFSANVQKIEKATAFKKVRTEAAHPTLNMPDASTASSHPHRPSFDSSRVSFDKSASSPSHAGTSFRKVQSGPGNTMRVSQQSNSNTKSPWGEAISDPAFGA